MFFAVTIEDCGFTDGRSVYAIARFNFAGNAFSPSGAEGIWLLELTRAAPCILRLEAVVSFSTSSSGILAVKSFCLLVRISPADLLLPCIKGIFSGLSSGDTFCARVSKRVRTPSSLFTPSWFETPSFILSVTGDSTSK